VHNVRLSVIFDVDVPRERDVYHLLSSFSSVYELKGYMLDALAFYSRVTRHPEEVFEGIVGASEERIVERMGALEERIVGRVGEMLAGVRVASVGGGVGGALSVSVASLGVDDEDVDFLRSLGGVLEA